jgi:preprotein translocase subunit YajC
MKPSDDAVDSKVVARGGLAGIVWEIAEIDLILGL